MRELAAAICTEMIDHRNYELDRERTVSEIRHRINKLAERKGE